MVFWNFYQKVYSVVSRILPSDIKGGPLHRAVSSEAHGKDLNKVEVDSGEEEAGCVLCLAEK